MQPQRLHGIGTNLCIVVKNIDTELRSLRIHVPVRSQFFDGTHHAVGRHPPQPAGFDRDSFFRKRAAVMAACHPAAVKHHRHLVPFFNIRCTGNDLDHL